MSEPARLSDVCPNCSHDWHGLPCIPVVPIMFGCPCESSIIEEEK